MLRGRDYYYAGCGAGCVVAMLIASFANAGLFSLPASFLPLQCRYGVCSKQTFRQRRRNGYPRAAHCSFGWAAKIYDGPLLAYLKRGFAQGCWYSALSWLHCQRGLSSPNIIGRLVFCFWSTARRVFPAEIRGDQQSAKRAALIARVRGDLWAESAFTHSDLLWRDPASTQDLGGGAATTHGRIWKMRFDTPPIVEM